MSKFVEYLEKDFRSRKEKNPNISLRSYAGMLGVSPSALSEVLRGKRKISSKMRERLGLKIGLSPLRIADLERNDCKLKKYYLLAEEVFSIISDRHVNVLLELARTKEFRWDSKWIANRLGTTVLTVRKLLKKLEASGMIRKISDQKYEDTTNGFTTDVNNQSTNEGKIRLQEQVVDYAKSSLRDIPYEQRSNSTITFAMKKSDIEFAREKIKQFRQELSQMLEASEDPDDVYHLNINLFPATSVKSGVKK